MVEDSDVRFYEKLPIFSHQIADVFEQEEFFADVPSDWQIIITDIKDSTQAVDQGNHQLVNLLATGSIIAVINIAQRNSFEIPFFFGGDGATILVPNEIKAATLQALKEHRDNTKASFELDLRVGIVPVHEIYQQGHQIKIARTSITDFLTIPIVLGEGLNAAEVMVKKSNYQLKQEEGGASMLDLTGMECRWDSIKPPKVPGEVMALLVDAVDLSRQGEIFARVLRSIEEIYGPIKSRNPISRQGLRIKASYQTIKTELQTKLGKYDLRKILKFWLFTWIGKLYYGKTKGSSTYLDNLVLLSDTLTIDGRINTVFSGSKAQRTALVKTLEALEEKGEILFGYYASPESVMSCYVRNRTDQHIHFVDGSEGGYTQASKMLKRKLRQAEDLS